MATSKTTSAAKAPAKKVAAPSKAPASTKAKPAAKPAVKAKPAPVAKVAKAPAAKPVVKKPVPKAAPTKAVAPVKAVAAEVKKTAKDLEQFGKQVELFQVPTSAAAKAPASAVKVTETVEVKVAALPQSTSKLVTGDQRSPKPVTPQPRFDKNAPRNKGGYKGNKPKNVQQHHRSGDPRHQTKSSDHRSNLTRKLLGDNAGAHSSAPVEVEAQVASLVPGIGAPAAQFASEALKAIKHASPETIDQISKTLSENLVDQFGTEAGNLATTVVKKITPDDGEKGSMLSVVQESMERAKLEGMPPDDAAKRSLRGALNKLMTTQHDVMNSPAKKNANGMLDLTSLFKAR